ncbi:MAG: sigma-70 family RNA polymerase sigma factor [Candidatus Gastranaerophilales bacterium]|nr:sigma-70 family RNA polymerase sigma factor [Candidatus Gastranaerophilales bacterium]
MKDIISKNSYKIKQIIKNFTGEYNEDLEQEVYIKTYKNLGKYSEQNKFSQWICTIAANLCRDYLRSSKFKKQSQTTNDEELLNNIANKKTPEIEYSQKERQKIILKEINALPKKMKEVIILYEFEDCSYEKIAQKLKIPEGTVKSRINNARKILKERLSFLMKEEN